MGTQSLSGGRYRLERPLGHGGMASVHLALDTELDRHVAVKLLAENLSGDEAFRARFLREARLAARLSHPNVVGVYDVGEDGGRPYIVMEYVEGETLADVMSARGRLSPDEARGLVLQACHGLAHAHDAGLVHRDVKPQNLILRPDGTLKVADFGIARAAEATALTQPGTILGTAAYLAPEQALGQPVTAATDVYAVGAVLYELLTGRPPIEIDSLADLADSQRTAAITPVRELVPEVPRWLEDAVMRCLAKNPAYRPASAGGLAGELASGGSEPPTEPLPRRLSGPRRRALVLALFGLLVLSAILLAVALSGRGDGSGRPSPPSAVPPIPAGSSPQDQARSMAAWLRKYSGP
ncbi:MAG: serine/threonine-protein kinase [Gaiellaceae bacterium]